MLDGLGGGSHVAVSTFPVAWRIEVVDEKNYRGGDCVR
jgi:hypothetical protein